VPWWGAVVIAVGLTAVGFAFDAGSGNEELTNFFGALYAAGCIVAVLAVRQQSVFTAVVQPPLILFVAVPSAYFLFHHSEIHGIKDILINCGYPLIERFVLMFTTTVIVLLIGMARWYFGAAARAGIRADTKTATKKVAAGAGAAALLAGLKTKLSTFTQRRRGDADKDPRRHAIDRPATARKPARAQRAANRAAPTRSRHARPPIDYVADPAAAPRRRRPTHARDLDEVVNNLDAEPAQRKRPGTPRDPNRRTPPPADRQQEPRRRDPDDRQPRPARRPDRYDPSYDMPPPPPRRRPAAGGADSTHHPVSRVRYRGTDADARGGQDGAQDGDVRHRRPPSRQSMDDWRYQG
jgi:hypothetical protein